MANEITASCGLTCAKGGASVSMSSSKVATMAGDQMITNVQNVGTSTEQLLFGDVTTIGYVLVKNMDTTNFCEISMETPASSNPFAKLLAGDICLFKPVSATVYALADTAAVNLAVTAVEL